MTSAEFRRVEVGPRGPLSSLAVVGLLADERTALTLRDGRAILVDQNGAGKTTMLRLLSAVMDASVDRLIDLDPQLVELQFQDGTELSISKKQIDAALRARKRHRGPPHIAEFADYLQSTVPFIDLRRFNHRTLARLLEWAKPQQRALFDAPSRPSTFIRRMAGEMGVDPEQLRAVVAGFEAPPDDDCDVSWVKKLKEAFPEKTLYLPTYRRVEMSFEHLAPALDSSEVFSGRYGRLIHFGMDDVSANLERLRESIRSAALAAFTHNSAQILEQFTDGVSVTPEMRERVMASNLEEVLGRVGPALPNSRRTKILDLVGSPKRIELKKFDPLVIYLHSLVDVYEAQRRDDSRIRHFVDAVNRFLEGEGESQPPSRTHKRLVYDSVSVVVKIEPGDLAWDSLSFGEKQLVSLLAQLLLEDSRHGVSLIIDEPELSLSVEWQKKLLPILSEMGLVHLVAATHSPFIFENELDEYATCLESS